MPEQTPPSSQLNARSTAAGAKIFPSRTAISLSTFYLTGYTGIVPDFGRDFKVRSLPEPVGTPTAAPKAGASRSASAPGDVRDKKPVPAGK